MLVYSCDSQPPKATLLSKAEFSFQTQDYDSAKSQLLKAFQGNKNKLEFQIFMAKILARKSQFDSSMQLLDKLEPNLTRTSASDLKYHYHLWRGYNLELNKMYDKSYSHYNEAFTLVDQIEDPFYVNFLHMQRLSLISEENYRDEAEKWIESYKRFLKKQNNKSFDSNFNYVLIQYYHFQDTLNMESKEKKERKEKSIYYAEEYLNSAIASKNDRTIAHAHFYQGLVLAEQLNEQASAREHFKKSLQLYSKLKIPLHRATSIFNVGRTYVRDSNWYLAKKWLYDAWAIKTQSRESHRRMQISENLMITYKEEKRWDSAFHFSELFKKFSDTVIDKKEAEQLRTKQREMFIDGQELRNEKNKKITYGFGGASGLIAIIAFLLFKNTKRKQRIAEQEKEIEIQKTEKILKEQELTTIDAMIEGQEKERQRLASDLHDSVGATLSAARLQFDHINKNKDKLDTLAAMFEKTGSLLDEAYNEVRSMAHLKNSGVIAKNGLLPAVEKLAKNASGTNKLKVEVQDFGLENRLENSLEITIFRIIQELVTNVIKHANASEATISITQHKDSLNIIVEDNGRGFDAQKFQQKEGMGLSGIERRIEHLEGTLEVDSSPGNGTSVLIDIPL